MVSNKADTIEEYILSLLSGVSDGSVEVNRAALADRVNCAPSQISYVLNTRFTNERGFRVESQRGLGGYIRITVIDADALNKKVLYGNMIGQISEATTFGMIRSMLAYLVDRRMITKREAELVAQTAFHLYKSASEDKITGVDRAEILRTMFMTLSKF